MMSHLIVVGFNHDMYRAAEVLNELKRLDESWAVDLRDAVAVYRDRTGALRTDQRVNKTTTEAAALGGLWGLMIGALAAIPFTAGASGGVVAGTIAAGALGGGALGATGEAARAELWKDEFGISESFINEVSGMLRPGDSAIFVLARSTNPTVLEDHFRGWGGTVLRSTLSPEQAERVQRTLDSYRNSHS